VCVHLTHHSPHARRTSSGFLPLAGSTKVGLIELRDTISTTADLDRRALPSARYGSAALAASSRVHTIYVYIYIYIYIYRTIFCT